MSELQCIRMHNRARKATSIALKTQSREESTCIWEHGIVSGRPHPIQVETRDRP